MQERQDNIRDALHGAFRALNSIYDKNNYFDLHDDSLITHGIPGNFPPNKEGMKNYYSEVWRAFPDAIFGFDHIIVEGSEASCMFSMSGTQKEEFLGLPPSDQQNRVDGMVFFHFKNSKIIERWEIIDILSAAKQLSVRQQISALKNAILEYGEVKANQELKQKIKGLFSRHLS
jgi:predicted ester cyclase